jgi:hypothetical protein
MRAVSGIRTRDRQVSSMLGRVGSENGPAIPEGCGHVKGETVRVSARKRRGENVGLLLPAFLRGGLRVFIVSSVCTYSVLY